jgi:hypothetical protein
MANLNEPKAPAEPSGPTHGPQPSASGGVQAGGVGASLRTGSDSVEPTPATEKAKLEGLVVQRPNSSTE